MNSYKKEWQKIDDLNRNQASLSPLYRPTSLDSLALSDESDDHCTSDEIPKSSDSEQEFDVTESKRNKHLIERFASLRSSGFNVQSVVKINTNFTDCNNNHENKKNDIHHKYEKHTDSFKTRLFKKSKHFNNGCSKSKSEESIFDSCNKSDNNNETKTSSSPPMKTILSKSDNNLADIEVTENVNNCKNKCDTISKTNCVSKTDTLGPKKSVDRMETIPEEGNETKISVKEILARFENMRASQRIEEVQFLDTLNQQPRSNLSTPVTSKADDGKPQHLPPGAKPAIGSPASNGGAVATAVAAAAAEVRARSPLLRNSSEPPASPPPPGGKHSLLQFAMQHFNNSPELEVLKMDASIKSKEKRKEWTWKQQTDLVKWQGTPLTTPLLRLESLLVPLALECFECILRYCGDLPPGPNGSPDEVRCVYTVLMHCHKHIPLRDEVYCQLMKQTTSNKSTNPDSCQRAWRLLSIVAAYFACSDSLTPFLSEHLSAAAADKRRACHGTAAVCLANLRKTQRCGGRKNVPSVEEVTAVSAGRSARRQIYRLPGGAERVVNTRCSTVVADVITELCNVIGVNEESEQQEFSLYCIVQGDAFTMPLAADEYILDVTTELHKAAQPFYLIFCRSVWYHPLRQDATPFYTEVLFNQVAPDYLEGLLLRLGNGTAPTPSDVRDMALVAALLHRAADLQHVPALKEVKFLLPRPVLGLREPSPQQWLGLVQNAWPQVALLSPTISKRQALHVLATWPLFGSSFFAVKRVVGPDAATWRDHILALNRNGVHFLDLATHETVQHWPFAEVISTRKVRSEDGALFLDMKCGSLLQQRVTRLQTEQAHEISRLVRQYITLEQANAATNGL